MPWAVTVMVFTPGSRHLPATDWVAQNFHWQSPLLPDHFQSHKPLAVAMGGVGLLCVRGSTPHVSTSKSFFRGDHRPRQTKELPGTTGIFSLAVITQCDNRQLVVLVLDSIGLFFGSFHVLSGHPCHPSLRRVYFTSTVDSSFVGGRSLYLGVHL